LAARWLQATAFWFLRHLVLFVIAGFLVWGFLWRESLLPGWFDSVSSRLPSGGGTAEQQVGATPDMAPARDAGAGPGGFRPIAPAEPAVPPAQAGKSPDELLQAARQAYWTGDPEAAERLYRELMVVRPGSPAAYGELGNLLLMQERGAEARELLSRAAALLAANGGDAAAAELRAYLGKPDG
jgi:hypothetical protein